MCFEYANSRHSFKIVVMGHIGLLRVVNGAKRETHGDGAVVTYSATRNVDGIWFDLLICEADDDFSLWDIDDPPYFERLRDADAIIAPYAIDDRKKFNSVINIREHCVMSVAIGNEEITEIIPPLYE